MQNTAIFLGATGNISYQAANVVIGIMQYAPQFANKIVLYYDAWSDNDLIALKRICPILELREYSFKTFLSKYDGPYDDKNWAARTFSHMVHVKYEIFDLLDEFDNVLWLDCDVLIHKNISGILDFGLVSLKPVTSLRTQCYESIPGFDDNVPAFNTGVILVKRNPELKGLTKKCYKLLSNHYQSLKMIDQAVFSMVFAENKIEVKPLPDKYNHKPNAIDLEEPLITHANLPHGKFWKSALSALLFPQWAKNHKKWLDEGGSDVNVTMTGLHRYNPSVKKSFDILSNCEYWERFFNRFAHLIDARIYIHYDFSQRYIRFIPRDIKGGAIFSIENHSNYLDIFFVIPVSSKLFNNSNTVLEKSFGAQIIQKREKDIRAKLRLQEFDVEIFNQFVDHCLRLINIQTLTWKDLKNDLYFKTSF